MNEQELKGPIHYRYECHDISDEGSIKATFQLQFHQLYVIEETPKGYWVSRWKGAKYKDKWVSKTSTKRWAYPTKEEAMTNYLKRTSRYIRILEYNLSKAKAGLKLAEAGESVKCLY